MMVLLKCFKSCIVGLSRRLFVSRKVNELVHEEAAKRKGVQLIRRFSGGGTVIVDHDTIFSGIIMNATDLPGVDCYPRPIMNWTSDFYAGVFNAYGEFNLRDQGDLLKACTASCLIQSKLSGETAPAVCLQFESLCSAKAEVIAVLCIVQQYSV